MGEIFSNEIFDMGNGLCFIDSKSSLNAPMNVETTQSGKRLVITFGVSGSSIYKNHGDKKTIPFCSGGTTITLFNDTKGIREISSGELRQNRIVMSEEFLRRNFFLALKAVNTRLSADKTPTILVNLTSKG